MAVQHRQVFKDVKMKKITHLTFGVFSPIDTQKISEIEVINRELYQHPERIPASYGPLDLRLGTSEKSKVCGTCDCRLTECDGHFGYVKLQFPIFHTGYFKTITNILQMICKTCSSVLLSPEEKRKYLVRYRSKKAQDVHFRRALFKSIYEKARKLIECHNCNSINGIVKKVGVMRLVHLPFKPKHREEMTEFQDSFQEATKHIKDLSPYISKAADDLNPQRVYNLFTHISALDCELLDLNPKAGRPEHMLITHILVPPVCIRPSVCSDPSQGTNEDDITMKLSDIIHINSCIKNGLQKGQPIPQLMEWWEHLQLSHSLLINSDAPGIPPLLQSSKPTRGYIQRLKGKTGRFRGNLSGKRVNFSARTVISPDPNLLIEQVAVPVLMAKVMTYPERVCSYNIKHLRRCIINGPDVHPGANFVIFSSGTDGGGDKRFLKYGDRKEIARLLKEGDIVERHMADGDVVLFNRQPSLHRMSIMAHRARVMPGRTLRFNECVCTPYNADFDGDEMNLHLPQTEEARAEAWTLMGVIRNLITTRNGEPLVAATQDFLTSAYLITRRDSFFDRSQFCLLCSYFSDAIEPIDLPPPTILKPLELWTGKQVFSVLIRPSVKSEVLVNLEIKARTYTRDIHMCPNDGYVCFQNSELLTGTLDKTTLGSGNKNNLFHVLMRDYSPEVAANRMSRLAKLSARWLGNRGFSIGISDVQPSADLRQKKQVLVENGYKKCDSFLEEYDTGTMIPMPGCTVEQTLEAKLNGELSEIRSRAGNLCTDELHYHNSPLIMTLSGSKGSKINISQMVACVGQQTVNGKRAPNDFINRSLPHFLENSRIPAAKGFVENSFYSGLVATEFWFHTMAGREGLVDTAVKTAETGYMYRRLSKSLEDLVLQYDVTVRTCSGVLIQFTYGDDLLDPSGMEADNKPVSLPRVFSHILASCPSRSEPDLTSSQITELVKWFLSVSPTDSDPFADLSAPTSNPVKGDEFLSQESKSKIVEGDKELKTKLFQYLTPTVRKEIFEFFIKEKSGFVSKVIEFEKSVTDKFIYEGVTIDQQTTKDEEDEMELDKEEQQKREERKRKEKEKERERLERELDENSKKMIKNTVSQLIRLTFPQLRSFLRTVYNKVLRASSEPGTAVGALAAQGIAEPCTQMTLKTFHFAGVSSMNITLGVPRIKEIINASKTISTPIITVTLQNKHDFNHAKKVKALIEKTTLSKILRHLKEVYRANSCYLSVRLDPRKIVSLNLDITPLVIKKAILEHKKLKLKETNVEIIGTYKLKVYPTDTSREKLYYNLRHLRNTLPDVVVAGLSQVERVVINKTKKDGVEEYNLLAEGYDLGKVMATPGVVGSETTSNHITEVQSRLGIEAARSTIINEIQYTMEGHGISVDVRHLMLLADQMTSRGEVLGITRFGIGKMTSSVLTLASFEKTSDHLFEAAAHSRSEQINGVSDSIILGMPIPLGTGMFKLLQKVNKINKTKKAPFLETQNFHLEI